MERKAGGLEVGLRKKPRKPALTLIFLLICFTVFHVGGRDTKGDPFQRRASRIERPMTLGSPALYTPHAPIFITNDDGFSAAGFPGDGTKENPYCIEGLNITSFAPKGLIYIENTQAYFQIKDNFIRGVGGILKAGIRLRQVRHGTIVHNVVTTCWAGIRLEDSEQNTLSYNTLSNNSEIGIHLEDSEQNMVSSNTVSNTMWAGICLKDSKQNTVSSNTVSNHSKSGIHLGGLEGNTFSSSSISNHHNFGIHLGGSEENTLSHNIVTKYDTGIFLGRSERNILDSNMVSNNSRSGITLGLSRLNTLVGNTLSNNGFYVYGDQVEDYIQATVMDNVVNGRPMVYWQNVQGGSVPPSAGQVLLVNTTGVEVTGQELSRASIGFLAVFSSNLDIHHNTLSQNYRAGIFLQESEDVRLVDNLLSDTTIDGIALWDTGNVLLSHNTVSQNWRGIALIDSENISITHNTVSNNEEGISLGKSERNILTYNTVSNNSGAGIELWNSGQNTVFGNKLVNNGLEVSGGQIEDYLQANVTTNLVNDKPLIYWQNVVGRMVPSGAGQVLLVNTTGIEVTGQELSRASIGFLAVFSSNLDVHHNTLSNNSRAGVFLQDSENAHFSYNIVSNTTNEGIVLQHLKHTTFSYNTVSHNGRTGIALEGSENITLSHNIISHNGWTGTSLELTYEWNEWEEYPSWTWAWSSKNWSGISLQNTRNNTIAHNTISNNRRDGIGLMYSEQNTIVGNTLINNGLYIMGFHIEDCLQASVVDNVVNGRPVVYWQNVQGGTIPPSVGQVLLVNTTGIEVTGQELSRASTGILAVFSSNLDIHHNTLSQNNRAGIFLWYSKNLTMTSNTISNCWTGIFLKKSEHPTLASNTVSNNSWTGIFLVTSKNATLTYNNISQNTWSGVFLVESKYNDLSNNTVSQNEIGILLGTSVQNTIKWNNFVGNTPKGGSQARDHGTNNIITSNYWNDHDNTDRNADGIADTPYVLEGLAHNQDPSPLVALANSSAMAKSFTPPKVSGFEWFLVFGGIPLLLWLRRRPRQR